MVRDRQYIISVILLTVERLGQGCLYKYINLAIAKDINYQVNKFKRYPDYLILRC